ncbi:MAG: ATP-binding protein [Rhodovarius sp.]|nr:ATP-binding protein [Rhodovarius sp.]
MSTLLRALQRLMPRGLMGRLLLILLAPLLVIQAVALISFYDGHMGIISRRLTYALAGEVALLAYSLPAVEEEGRAALLDQARLRLGLRADWQPGAVLGFVPRRPPWSPFLPLEEDLIIALQRQLGLPFDADWVGTPGTIVIRVQLPEGVLEVAAPRQRLFTTTFVVFVVWLVGFALIVAVIAVLFMRIQVRAIRRLADAAQAFGQGRDVGPIRPEGAAEVRQAAIAFNRMQENIRRFIAQRTEMLAGISHDLRTPITRMRLTLAMLPRSPETAEDIAALEQDVQEMERLVETYLAFARGEGTEKPRQCDLVPILRELAAAARRSGAEVTENLPEELSLPVREGALRRAIGNLLDNARRHGRRVALSARAEGNLAEVLVDDDGPGIPEADREAAFRPFSTGSATGTGLGLAIARDVVRRHGGEIALEDSPLGGLRARVRLPM